MIEYQGHHKLYEGKAKIMFGSDESESLIQYFKDSMTAFNGEKLSIIPGKGAINCQFDRKVMNILSGYGIKTHYISAVDDRASKVLPAQVFGIEVTMRNYCAGKSIVKRVKIPYGQRLPTAICEFMLKDDSLNDPLIGEDYIVKFGLATVRQLREIKYIAGRINDILSGYFLARNTILLDSKLEFGLYNGEIILVDEISPDTCRLWDADTRTILDKDVFRLETDDANIIIDRYTEALRRVL